jgi:heat shock protein HtpX
VAAKLMQFAVSRRRESLADVSGVSLTRYPPGLISALEKLRQDTTVVHSSSRATAHLWIESPLARTDEEGRLSRLNRLFDTHPPLDERIKALEEL